MTENTTPDPAGAEDVPKTPTEAVTETAEQKTPQEQAAEQQPAQEAGTATQEPGADPEPEKRKVNPITKRIDDLTAARRTAERNEREAKARAYELEARLAKLETTAPKLEDFEFDEGAHQQALIEHAIKQARKQELTDDAEAVQQAGKVAASEAGAVKQQAYTLRAQQFADTAPDFADVVNNSAVQVSEAVSAQILDSDMGPQIAYYMAKNPGETADLATLQNPVEAARAIGRIEARLSQPPPKRTSTAPPPMQPIANNPGARPGFDPATASVADYEAVLKKAGVI